MIAPAAALLLVLAAPDPPAADAEAPRVAIEPSGFDFGRTLQQRVLKKTFRVRNFGGRELVIGRVAWDCDCTVAELSAEERRVPPGEAVDLRVTLYTRRALGRLSRRVVVETNDPESERVELKLEADVQPARHPRATPR